MTQIKFNKNIEPSWPNKNLELRGPFPGLFDSTKKIPTDYAPVVYWIKIMVVLIFLGWKDGYFLRGFLPESRSIQLDGTYLNS